MGKLTADLVRRLKPSDKNRRHSDGDGLSLVVRPNGSKAWQVRLGKTDHGIGAYPGVKLAEARQKAQAKRNDVDVTPPTPRATTFADVAELYIRTHEPTWKTPKTAATLRSRLATYAYPALGARPIKGIRREDVTPVLMAIWTDKPTVGRKLKQLMGKVFVHAMAHGWAESNPVDDVVSQALPKTAITKSHHESLPYADVQAALRIAATSTSGASVRLCYRWQILTASRPGEARAARWQDMDMQGRTWTIPGDMMKSGREHRVPMSSQAADILNEAMALMDGSGLVFPGRSAGKPLGDMTLTALLRSTGLTSTATMHGFRTTFKTWCMEQTDTPWAVGEAALSHTLGNSTEQAYARTDLFDRRRELMQHWADFTG